MTHAGTPRFIATSQIDLETDTIHGPLQSRLFQEPEADITVELRFGRRIHHDHMAGDLCLCAAPPRAVWQIDGEERPLSTMSFIAVWNSGVTAIGGHAVECFLMPFETMEMPFVAWHPSGTFQLVRYDRKTDTFRRRILYPAVWPEVSDVMAAYNGQDL